MEACNIVGNQPDPAEIPVRFDELLLETQQVFQIYELLETRYSSEGQFLGKGLAELGMLAKYSQMEEEHMLFYVSMIRYMDSLYREISGDNITKEMNSGKKEADK